MKSYLTSDYFARRRHALGDGAQLFLQLGGWVVEVGRHGGGFDKVQVILKCEYYAMNL